MPGLPIPMTPGPYGVRRFAAGGQPSDELMPTDFGPMQFAPIGPKQPSQADQSGPQSFGQPALPSRPPNPFQGRPLQAPGVPSPAEVAPLMQPPQTMYPSGFDPNAESPGKMSYSGPQLNTPQALAGLQAAQPFQHPLLQLAGMSQQAGPGENPVWGAQREHYLQGQLQPMREQQAPVNAALQAQHPAILGLGQLQAQQKALPQQYEAMGRTNQARYEAQGRLGAANSMAQGRQQQAVMGLLAPLLKQLGDAQQRSREFSGSGYDQFEEGNVMDEQMLKGLLGQLLGRPEFSY